METRDFFRLIYITDRKRTAGRELIGVIRAALEGGVDAVQLREKDLSERAYLKLAEEAVQLCREHDAKLIINGRPELVSQFEDVGLHIGSSHPEPFAVRRDFSLQGRLIGYSSHSVHEALEAVASGADYVSFSPVFQTRKPDAFLPPTGPEALAELVGLSRVPVTALGGIYLENTAQLKGTGVKSLSVVSAISEADDPTEAARSLKSEVLSWSGFTPPSSGLLW